MRNKIKLKMITMRNISAMARTIIILLRELQR